VTVPAPALLLAAALAAPGSREAPALSRAERRIVRRVDSLSAGAESLLERVVDVNSGTMNFDGVREVGAIFRKELDALTAIAREAGAGGLIWARRGAGAWEGQGVKAVGGALLDALGGAEGDLLLAVAGSDRITSPALHAVRAALIRRPDARPLAAHAFAWIVDFPLFELDPDTGRYVPAHHPFTAPHPADAARLARARASAVSK